MDINVIMDAISLMGFPIVCCGALFWMINKQNDQHRVEMEKMTEAVNNNTIMLQKVLDRWGVNANE